MLTRISGFGQVKVPESAGGDKTKAAAEGAASGAALGPVGAAAGAGLALFSKGLEEKKKSAEGRSQRKAAAGPLNEGLTSINHLLEVTKTYRGTLVPETTYREFVTELTHAVNKINEAIAAVKRARGISGFGRTEAEKRADTIKWAQTLSTNTQKKVEEIMGNISTGRQKVAPAVESAPSTAPSYAQTGTRPAAAPSGGGGSMAALIPLALLFFLR